MECLRNKERPDEVRTLSQTTIRLEFEVKKADGSRTGRAIGRRRAGPVRRNRAMSRRHCYLSTVLTVD